MQIWDCQVTVTCNYESDVCSYKKVFLSTGTTHGDEMMYMFNVPLPIVLCPLDEFFCE